MLKLKKLHVVADFGAETLESFWVKNINEILNYTFIWITFIHLNNNKVNVYDASNREILKIRRDFVCCGGCCSSTSYTLPVETPDGQIFGYVKQVYVNFINILLLFNIYNLNLKVEEFIVHNMIY